MKTKELDISIGKEISISIGDFFELAGEEGVYEVETPQGWVEIGCLVKKANKECYTIRTKTGKILSGSNDHYVETKKGWVKMEDIDVQNCFINTVTGEEEIVSLESIGVHDTFDLEVLNDDHKYYSNDIVSHNTGKTTAGHIICNNLPDYTVVWITPDSIQQNNYRTVSSIKLLYKLAEYVTPCALLLEDLDLFSEDRDMSRDSLSLGGLMNILDGVNSINNSVTIGTTNRLESMEKAIRNRPGRFDRIVEIPSLAPELREKMFKSRLAEWKVPEKILNWLVGETEGSTGAEIQEFVNTLHLKYINNKKIGKNLTQKIVDEVIEKMEKFGISNNKSFGFGKKDLD
tara:strand:+ start:2089 stop:3123 length:1035 start_codon:yes stop_codon:yes gene_type:complete